MNVVLIEPEIPANTGNVARLCAITGAALHLVHPLGFFLNDKKLKRAGLDYWDKLDLIIHDGIEEFFATVGDKSVFLVETGGDTLYSDVSYSWGNDYLIFGSETTGLSPDLLLKYQERIVTLPMAVPRSLNLANTVAIVVYEAWRQNQFPGRILLSGNE